MDKALPALGVFLLCALLPLRAQSGVSPFAGNQAGSAYSGDISGDRFEEVEGRGLQIRTRPAGARVFVDGLERGPSPLLLDTLASGEYRVRLAKDGYEDREFTVRVLAGSRLDVSIELKEAEGLVLILLGREKVPPAYPFNPEIFVDGVPFASRSLRAAQPETQGEAARDGTAREEVPEISRYTLSLPGGRRSLRIVSFGWKDAGEDVLVRPGETVSLEIRLSPAPFRLFPGPGPDRSRFNPANPGALGSITYGFAVSAPGRGILRVLDREGRELRTEELPPFKASPQRLIWNGRDSRKQPLPDGDYTLIIEAAPEFDIAPAAPDAASAAAEGRRISVPVSIDSSIAHYPLSLFGAVSGLLFSPLPLTLPRGGFQIQGNVLFGHPAGPAGEAFSGLSFEGGFRFSPLERLEFAAALEAFPASDNAAQWGFSLSPKWQFLKAGPLEAAAAAGFSWSGDMDVSPRRGGANLHLPLSWNPVPPLSLVLSPGLYWRQWREGNPRLLLGAGALYRFAGFFAGLSLRQEYRTAGHGDTASETGSPVLLLGAAELKWQPPRTNLVLALTGGFRHQAGENTGFGGLGLGAVY
jgi:hypothetical protein